jgi:hypothetical protein
LAATQTTNFGLCIDSNANLVDGIDYNGQLATTLANVPDYSGVVLGVGQAYTPLSLGPDGQRVLCAAIGMMSGPDPNDWQNTLLWQATADISNAIYATILKPGNAGVVSPTQQALLCATAKAIWSFTTAQPPSGANSVDVTNGATLAPATDKDFSCLTTDAGCSTAANQPTWLTNSGPGPVVLVSLASNPNNLDFGSATATACGWP